MNAVRMPLSRRLVDHKRGRRCHIQRLDRRLHWNREALISPLDDGRGQATSLAAKHDCSGNA
jgi:hypothetical protein